MKNLRLFLRSLHWLNKQRVLNCFLVWNASYCALQHVCPCSYQTKRCQVRSENPHLTSGIRVADSALSPYVASPPAHDSFLLYAVYSNVCHIYSACAFPSSNNLPDIGVSSLISLSSPGVLQLWSSLLATSHISFHFLLGFVFLISALAVKIHFNHVFFSAIN